MPQTQPELKKYLDRRLGVSINGSRVIEGSLRGYDLFLNMVLDNAVEVQKDGTRTSIGTAVVRGNAVVMLEAKERLGGEDRGPR